MDENFQFFSVSSIRSRNIRFCSFFLKRGERICTLRSHFWRYCSKLRMSSKRSSQMFLPAALEAALPLPEIPDAPGGRALLVTMQNFCRPMKVVTTKTLFFYHRVFDESNDC